MNHNTRLNAKKGFETSPLHHQSILAMAPARPTQHEPHICLSETAISQSQSRHLLTMAQYYQGLFGRQLWFIGVIAGLKDTTRGQGCCYMLQLSSLDKMSSLSVSSPSLGQSSADMSASFLCLPNIKWKYQFIVFWTFRALSKCRLLPKLHDQVLKLWQQEAPTI